MHFNVLDIVRGTTVDGPGFRTAIYLAGCHHHCPGCHNPQSHDPDGGVEMTLEEILDVVREEDFDVTLSGGDPLFFPDKAAALVNAVKSVGHEVWVYTGYRWEDITMQPSLMKAVEHAEVVVDGPFVQALHDPDLLFRGSSNQRLIDVAVSLAQGEAVEWGS